MSPPTRSPAASTSTLAPMSLRMDSSRRATLASCLERLGMDTSSRNSSVSRFRLIIAPQSPRCSRIQRRLRSTASSRCAHLGQPMIGPGDQVQGPRLPRPLEQRGAHAPAAPPRPAPPAPPAHGLPRWGPPHAGRSAPRPPGPGPSPVASDISRALQRGQIRGRVPSYHRQRGCARLDAAMGDMPGDEAAHARAQQADTVGQRGMLARDGRAPPPDRRCGWRWWRRGRSRPTRRRRGSRSAPGPGPPRAASGRGAGTCRCPSRRRGRGKRRRGAPRAREGGRCRTPTTGTPSTATVNRPGARGGRSQAQTRWKSRQAFTLRRYIVSSTGRRLILATSSATRAAIQGPDVVFSNSPL